MILTRTPFRISLGGGSTDLPSYYQHHGGFIFGVAMDWYFDTFVRRRKFDNNIQFQWSGNDQTVDAPEKISHFIGREALRITGTNNATGVGFQADTPAGTGLGSSGSCAVGLLHALFALKGVNKTKQEIAEHAFEITQRLGWPDGKQDPYIAALGGFVAFNIDRDGSVSLIEIHISEKTVARFLSQTLLFYTGMKRRSTALLSAQADHKVIEMKHRTLQIGRNVLRVFEEGDIDQFGYLMDEHWHVKKEMAEGMSNDAFDNVYEEAKRAGALGGKILGAGGGGYFMFCVPDGKQEEVSSAVTKMGLRKVDFGLDYDGTRVLFDSTTH